jgi:ABC-type spermidine/putrescine transport system permease subunit II
MHGLRAGYSVEGWSEAAADNDGVKPAGNDLMDGAAATSVATCLAVPGAVAVLATAA